MVRVIWDPGEFMGGEKRTFYEFTFGRMNSQILCYNIRLLLEMNAKYINKYQMKRATTQERSTDET